MTIRTTKRFRIPFNDLRPITKLCEEELTRAFKRVLKSGHFILGPELEAFEAELSAYTGYKYSVGVASGTDALTLALIASGCGPGKKVVTVANSVPATVLAIRRTGAAWDYIDVEGRTGLANVLLAHDDLLTANYFVPVNLYGQTTDLRMLNSGSAFDNLTIIEDSCQAFRSGRRLLRDKRPPGKDCECFSFYPTKNLGGYGDGGAISTDSELTASRIRKLRNYGLEGPRLDSYGMNSRLDELQAALLRVRLKYVAQVNEYKRWTANRYSQELHCNKLVSNHITLLRSDVNTNYHLYPIFVNAEGKRDELQKYLEADGIVTSVHYRIPAHLQPPEQGRVERMSHLQNTVRLCNTELSLPNFYGMTESQIVKVAKSIRRFFHA
jgi:dTDP-4-amino-4,6-dideoxygalactose transaminase